MTSTNDGKDVKSNQSSGQKGKTYYIELYKSLDARLSGECDLRARTQHLCEAWRRVHALCLQALPATHPHLLSWLQKHTARTILQTEWQSPKSKNEQTSLEEAIDAFVAECRTGVACKDGVRPPWESQLQQRGEWFKRILANPWGHPVLRALLDPQGSKPSDEEILEWLKEERGVMFVTRLRQLAASKCDDLAMALVTAVMDRVRATAALVPDSDQADEPKDKPNPPSDRPTFEHVLKTEAGFTLDVWELLTDIEFVLLHKGDRHSKCIELAKQTPLRNGYLLVDRLQSRLGASPRERKLWKNAKEVATLVAQVIIARCMVVPVCAHVTRTALICCTRSLVRLLPAAKLPAAAAALAAPAVTARHLHTLAQAVDTQLHQSRCTDMKPFVCELYVRAITAGMNELERHKLKTEKESEARLLEQTLSAWFMQLGVLLSASARVQCECTLTAFSVHPAPDMYDKIRAAPPLPPVALDTLDTQEETTSEFGSWTTDSRTQSNLVKTSETLNIKHTRNRANVMSTAILTEGEAIGLSPELCQDLAVLLSGPRVKTLSWDMDREALVEHCRAHMERTRGGTRALTTELKYLNLDPASYSHLPEEDDDENNLYYGIEKGYEHLVEIPDPEDVWQDSYDAERTESACSSSMEMETATMRRKKKTKRMSMSSGEDSDPLSLIAEVKRGEKKKERPHSKERSNKQGSKERKKKTKSKENSENKEGSRERRKENPEDKDKKKEKKQRKKKTKPDQQAVQPGDAKPGSLSSLIGMKVAKIKIPEGKYKNTNVDTKGPICITDSDYDSQGKSSLASMNSEGNDPDVLFDGIFSMEDYKSPENDPLADRNTLSNSELCVADGKVSINSARTLQTDKMESSINQHIKNSHTKPVSTPNNMNAQNVDLNTPKNVNAVKEEIKKNISRLIEFRRQKSIIEESKRKIMPSPGSSGSPRVIGSTGPTPIYKSPNAIKRDFPEQPLITSPKALVVPEIPKTYINKVQVEHIPEVKQEFDSSYTANYSRPVIQYANKYIPPTSYGDAYAQSVLHQDRPEPARHSHQPSTHSPSVTTDAIMQKTFQDFLKELQESINAGTGVNKVVSAKHPQQPKKEVRPISRVQPVIPKNKIVKLEPGTSSQCAKSIQTTKKVDNQLNTFSRLSYMHKTKQNDCKINRTTVDALMNYKDQALAKAIEDQKAAKLKLLQFKGDVVISRVGQTAQNLSMKDDAKGLIRKVEKPTTNTAKEHPMLSDILFSTSHGAVPKNVPRQDNQMRSNYHQIEKARTQTPRVIAPASVKESALSEKDQNDLLLLLRQQNKLNSPTSYLNTDAHKIANNMANNIHYSNPMPSNVTPNYNQMAAANRTVIKNYPTEIKNNNTHHETFNKSKAIHEANQNIHSRPSDSKSVKISKSVTSKKANVPQNKVMNVTPNNPDIPSSVSHGTKSTVTQPAEKRQEWENVMDDILKHKTPSRGPNALELALKKDSYMNSNLRNQRITRTNLVLDAETKVEKSEPQKPVVAKHVMPSVIQRKMNSVSPVIEGYSKPNPQYQSVVIKSPMQPSVIEASFKKQRPAHIQAEVIKSQMQNPIQPVKTQAPVVELQKRQIEVPRKVQTTDIVKEKEVTGIPNSDYDLLDELMDDELRQEIGELSSDEESYRTPAVNFAQAKTASSKYTNLIKNPTPQQDKFHAIDLRCGVKPADIRIQTNKQPVKCQNAPKSVIDYRPHQIPMTTTENPKAEQILSNVPVSTSVHTNVIQPNMTVNNQINEHPAYNVCQNINSGHINVVDPRNVIITVPQPVMPNVVLMGPELVYDPYTVSAQMQPGLCNVNQTPFVVKTAPNITLYQSTQYAAPVMNEMIIGNAMTMPMPMSTNQSQQTTVQNLTHSTNIIHDSPNDLLENKQINIDNTPLETKIENPVFDSRPNRDANLDINSNKNCERKVLSEVQENQTVNVTEKVEHKINKNEKIPEIEKDEEKFHAEVKAEKELELQVEHVPKRNIKDQDRIREKRLAILNRELNHRSGAPAIPLGYVPLKKETPIIYKTKQQNKLDNQSNANIESSNPVLNNAKVDKSSNEEQEADNSKENEEKTAPFRRILLRSSNDLKAMSVSNPQDQRNPVGRKTKVRLKDAEAEPTDTNIQQKSPLNNVVKNNEEQDSTKRVSKRILKKQAEKNNTQTNIVNEPMAATVIIQPVQKKTNNKKQKVPLNESKNDEIVENKQVTDKVNKKEVVDNTGTVIVNLDVNKKVETKPLVTPDISDFAVIDIEDALLGSKIPKIALITESEKKEDSKNDEKIVTRNKSNAPKKTVRKRRSSNKAQATESNNQVPDTNSSTNSESSTAAKKSVKKNKTVVTRQDKPFSDTTSTTNTSIGELNKTPMTLESNRPVNSIQVSSDSFTTLGTESSTEIKFVVNKATKTVETTTKTITVTPSTKTGLDNSAQLESKPSTTADIISSETKDKTSDTSNKITTALAENNKIINEKSPCNKKPNTDVVKKTVKNADTSNNTIEPVQSNQDSTVLDTISADNANETRKVDAKIIEPKDSPKRITRSTSRSSLSSDNDKVDESKLVKNKTTELETSPVTKTKNGKIKENIISTSDNNSNLTEDQLPSKANDMNTSNDMNSENNTESNDITGVISKEPNINVQSNTETNSNIRKPTSKNAFDHTKHSSQISQSALESLKDISIEELPRIPGSEDRKCVCIKLPNGKTFRATVFGKMHVSFESLLADPAIRAALLNNIHDTKRYTVNIKQITTMPKNDPTKIVETRIEEVNVQTQQSKPVETVNLLSDDEDESQSNQDICKSHVLKTEFGEFKISQIDESCFSKHQEKLLQKSFVKLTSIKASVSKQTQSDSIANDHKHAIAKIVQALKSTNEISITNNTPLNALSASIKAENNDTFKKTLAPDIVAPALKIDDEIIEIDDDSSEDSVDFRQTSANKAKPCDEFTPKENILEGLSIPQKEVEPGKKPENDIDELKHLLLKDLGVALGDAGKSDKDDSSNTDLPTDTRVKLKECFVKLQKCDDLIEKYEQISIINQKCTVDLIRCDANINTEKCVISNEDDVLDLPSDFIESDADATESRSTRSGSFSLLDGVTVYEGKSDQKSPKKGECRGSPVKQADTEISSLRKSIQAEESLTVMEAFDLIASLRKSTLAEIEVLVDFECFCDWHATKHELHVLSKMELLETQSNINDIPLFYESTFNSSADELSAVPTLKTITAKWLQEHDILNQFRPYLFSGEPIHTLKRKLRNGEDASVANKLLKGIGTQTCDRKIEKKMCVEVSDPIKLQNEPYGRSETANTNVIHKCTDLNVLKDIITNETENNINVIQTNQKIEIAYTDSSAQLDEIPSQGQNPSQDISKLGDLEQVINSENEQKNAHKSKDVDSIVTDGTPETITTRAIPAGCEGIQHSKGVNTQETAKQTHNDSSEHANTLDRVDDTNTDFVDIDSNSFENTVITNLDNSIEHSTGDQVSNRNSQENTSVLKLDKLEDENQSRADIDSKSEVISKAVVHEENECVTSNNQRDVDNIENNGCDNQVAENKLNTGEEFKEVISDCTGVNFEKQTETERNASHLSKKIFGQEKLTHDSVVEKAIVNSASESMIETGYMSGSVLTVEKNKGNCNEENAQSDNSTDLNLPELRLNENSGDKTDVQKQVNNSESGLLNKNKVEFSVSMKQEDYHTVNYSEAIRTNHSDIELLTEIKVEADYDSTLDSSLDGSENLTETENTRLSDKESEKKGALDNSKENKTEKQASTLTHNTVNAASFENVLLKNNNETIKSVNENIDFVAKDIVIGNESALSDDSLGVKQIAEELITATSTTDNSAAEIESAENYLEKETINKQYKKQPLLAHVFDHEYAVKDFLSAPKNTEFIDPSNLKLKSRVGNDFVLNGIEYEDPVDGTCFMFPIAETNSLSCENDNLFAEPEEIIQVTQEIGEDGTVGNVTLETKEVYPEDTYLKLILPKLTYSRNTSKYGKNKRLLKRKIDMSDIRISEKKYRKSKNIDYPKVKSNSISDCAYHKEFKSVIDYCSTLKFSYSQPFHKDYIDVDDIIRNWPIVTVPCCNDFQSDFSDGILFCDLDNIDRSEVFNPADLSLADEISVQYSESDLSSSNVAETNFNMGFGEGSDRVIQNLEDVGDDSKFSAATLSDVKQPQPFLMSEDKSNIKTDQEAHRDKMRDDQIKQLKRYLTYIQMRDKVRSFFKKTSVELKYEWIKQDKEHNRCDLMNFPFDLYNTTDFIEPPSTNVVVKVVQVGQLPVSAAAQNPVTCDPRVTQVSDASPSQCSVENSPQDDSQPTIKTEYTELTTADLSVPLMQEYAQHNQMLPMESQEQPNMPMTDENIPIETEIKSVVKIELMEEPEEKEEPPDTYENCEPQDLENKHVNNMDYPFDTNSDNATPAMEPEPDYQAIYNAVEKQDIAEPYPSPPEQKVNGVPEKTDQIAHAMNAAGITTTSETIANTRAHALVNILSQKLRQGSVGTSPTATNSYPKTTAINAMALQQALAQILPPPLNQTNAPENNQQGQNQVTPQLLHIVQGKNASGSQITLVDNSQQSVINAPNATPVLHIVQNKSGSANATSNGGAPQQTNSFGGLSLVDAGLQQGGNQLLHIVNTGNQKNNNAAGQLLKRVNLLTNLTNVQGSNEQKMVQFVCKSADGKSIQLNAPHQRSMVLRLQPIETPNVQTPPKPEGQDLSPASSAANSIPGKDSASQQEIKSRSVYEENYAKFIQNSSSKTGSEKSTSLPKFNQAFGKPVFQEGNQNQNDMNGNNSHLSVTTKTEPSECQATDNAINLDHIGQISSPPLLLRKSPAQTSQPQANLVQQLKQTITPMNIQTMHGGVIYTRQIPVNIGGGQTINLITVPSTELVDESGQKQQPVGNQNEMEPSIIKIVPQNQTASNNEMSSEDGSTPMNVSNEANQNPQPQPVLTQMRIKLPMLSKAPQMVSGARVVRPSFFQIQRNVIGGTNQPVYQQLVLTAAPPLGQQTIRLPQTSRQIKVPTDQSSAESQMSSSTLEQLREFDMVLEQVKERSSVPPNSSSSSFPKLHTPSTDTTDGSSASSTSTEGTQQVLYSIGNNHQPLNVAYVNRKATVATPMTSTFVRSPDSSGIVDSPTSSSHVQIPHTVTTETTHNDPPPQPKPKVSSKSKSRPKSSHPPNSLKLNTVPPKTSAQKPLEDEQTTQRILYILAEYKEQVENSPDKDKPAPRRRSNPPSNPSGHSKRKKSSSGSRRHGRDMSPIHGEDTCRTMGSEDSSCGTSQGDCNESCLESHSPQDSPRKVVRKLTFEQETPAPTPRPQPQRNVIVADGQTITVARGTAGKPATAVLMPANYILPVSMVKGGQQIAIVTNRGPKLLTVGGGEGGATNALLLQRLIGPAGLKPVLARPGVRHVRLPTAALHNLQAFNLATATTVQPPDSTASPAPAPTPPELVDTRATSSPWTDRDCHDVKPERGSSPEGSEPWNLPSSGDPHDYSYEETVRADHLDRTVLDAIPDRYSPDMEAQRIFDKMFDVESRKSYMGDSPRCAYDIDASDCDDKPYHQVVQKKDGSSHRQHRLTHVSAAALRHKYAILEHELRLQKSLSEECEDLGVDSPSASELFPEAELLFATSPAHDHTQDQGHHSHTPQPTLLNQSGIPQPDMDDQIATDQLLQRGDMHEDHQDLNLGLEDVGIVTVSEDGMQATIALDQEEFARSHPNTTFHSEPDEGEVQPFTIAGLKGRHITSTIFHSNRAPATVLMTAPQTTVISQATADHHHHHQPNAVKYDIDNMINSLPSHNGNNINLSSVLVKDEGLTRFDSILSDSRELHLSNTASAIVHSAGNATQVIRRVCYEDDKRDNRFLMDEPDALIAGDDAKMIAEDSSRDATLESMAGDVDDDRSSPERHAELFWESNSASERSESRRRLDFSSDSEKCCKSPSYDETNSTDSSGVGAHMRLDSVIKEARGARGGRGRRGGRSGSADGSSADDALPPLRTYPPKRPYHPLDDERSLSGKTRAGERSPDPARRRASGRGVVKRGCHCCNGDPAPPRAKKPRARRLAMDFAAN